GFFVIGQLPVYSNVTVLPSFDISPVPFMMPVLWLSIHVATSFCETLSNPHNPKPLYGPMPGMSPSISIFTNRPSIKGVTVVVHSDVIGAWSGSIHMLLLPVHVPTPLRISACSLPGMPATMQACMSSIVQPGGNFISGRPPGFDSPFS